MSKAFRDLFFNYYRNKYLNIIPQQASIPLEQLEAVTRERDELKEQIENDAMFAGPCGHWWKGWHEDTPCPVCPITQERDKAQEEVARLREALQNIFALTYQSYDAESLLLSAINLAEKALSQPLSQATPKKIDELKGDTNG
jgi:hypothetical protein